MWPNINWNNAEDTLKVQVSNLEERSKYEEISVAYDLILNDENLKTEYLRVRSALILLAYCTFSENSFNVKKFHERLIAWTDINSETNAFSKIWDLDSEGGFLLAIADFKKWILSKEWLKSFLENFMVEMIDELNQISEKSWIKLQPWDESIQDTKFLEDIVISASRPGWVLNKAIKAEMISRMWEKNVSSAIKKTAWNITVVDFKK